MKSASGAAAKSEPMTTRRKPWISDKRPPRSVPKAPAASIAAIAMLPVPSLESSVRQTYSGTNAWNANSENVLPSNSSNPAWSIPLVGILTLIFSRPSRAVEPFVGPDV